MDYRIINNWSKLFESMEGVEHCEESIVNEGGRFGITKPDALGAAINSKISPDIYAGKDGGETKDLYYADFKVNISDASTLKNRFPELRNKNIPSKATFIFFMCNEGQLEPERMVSYINDMSEDEGWEEFGFKELSTDDIIYLGSVDLKQNKKQDLFVVKNESFESDIEDISKRKEIYEAFDTIRDDYSNSTLALKFGNKEYLKLYLEQDYNVLQKLDDEHDYLLLIALKGQLRRDQINNILEEIDAVSDILGGKEPSEAQVENIGTISGIARNKELREYGVQQFDVFAMKVQ